MALTASLRTNDAIQHLKKIKPFDGWSSDVYLNKYGECLTMLRRRNIPLGDVGFGELYYDKTSGCVVGLKSKNATGPDNGVVLVESDGTVCRNQHKIPLTLPPISHAGKSTAVHQFGETSGSNTVRENLRRARESRRHVQQTPRNQQQQPTALNDEQNKLLLKYAALAVMFAVFMRALATFISGIAILLIPLLFYASQNCPSDGSFDAKKEIKRVLRGVHLSEDDPNKPKGWLEETIARASASVATELATGLGYTVTLTHFYGFATFANARVPTAKMDLYWIGAFGKWWYITSRSIPEDDLH
eukprot:CAMPEP_0195510252 /NCGR_PEP_ID=MMETSP0794_2-20130614/2944_1 /TAXON_ID=515487 /ORGANISM="Stephanopyxis turris, Strain CCMP 815" /LENGTH=301 /DNA_ID=CAMNT_0040637631 /DNA_START=33 /DNA_END=938 /DNA_ORIENTATION=+